MSTTRLVVHSLSALTRYPLRSAFVMLASLVGVAALTLVVSVGQGVQAKVARTVGQVLGDSSILVMSGGSRILGSPRAGASRLTIDDVRTVAAELDEIEAWDPQQDIATVVRYRERTTTVRILGQSERGERVWTRPVSRGHYFDVAAVASSACVAVIGETVARTLFPPDDPIGHDGARNRDALFLPARELLRVMCRTVRQTDDGQRGSRALTPLLLREIRQQQRQLHIREGGEHWDQVVKLEDEPHVAAAPLRKRAFGQRGHIGGAHRHGAERRPIDAPDAIEQRRLAGP
jgi:MacB-like periplasmic core domain